MGLTVRQLHQLHWIFRKKSVIKIVSAIQLHQLQDKQFTTGQNCFKICVLTWQSTCIELFCYYFGFDVRIHTRWNYIVALGRFFPYIQTLFTISLRFQLFVYCFGSAYIKTIPCEVYLTRYLFSSSFKRQKVCCIYRFFIK